MTTAARAGRIGSGLIAAALAARPGVAAAQTGPNRAGVSGAEFRQVEVGDDPQRVAIRQAVVPFGLVVPLGRFAVDLGGAYAWSSLTAGQSGERTVSGLTDTQVRGSLTLGRDRAVVTLLVNLPTGVDRIPLANAPVAGAVSSSFFAFPVNAYGSGFSATSGVALAAPAGRWNLGVAGSVRVSGRFTPFADATEELSYRPGLEGRLRVGVDRTIGRSRVEAGFTYSTFGNDEYGAGTASQGRYRPGARWIGEASLTAPVGSRTLLTLFGWHFARSAGDTADVGLPNDEKLTAGGGTLRIEASPRLSLEVGLEARRTREGDGSGWLGGGRAGAGIALGSGLSVSVSARLDGGRLDGGGGRRSVRGFGSSVFVRKSW